MELPLPGQEEEDRFVARLTGADADVLTEAIESAITAQRPRLAARLFGLLEEELDIEPGSELDRARRAARFLVVEGGPAALAQHWDDLQSSWTLARRTLAKRRRIRRRSRLEGKDPSQDRLNRHRRRR